MDITSGAISTQTDSNHQSKKGVGIGYSFPLLLDGNNKYLAIPCSSSGSILSYIWEDVLLFCNLFSYFSFFWLDGLHSHFAIFLNIISKKLKKLLREFEWYDVIHLLKAFENLFKICDSSALLC